MVTSWAVPQLEEVNVSVAPEPTDRPGLPDVRLTVTVTVEAGGAESVTPKVPLEPCGTDSAAGAATMRGGGGAAGSI